MRRLVFVTGNAGKAREARQRLEPLGLRVVPRDLRLVEVQADDLETVARAKAGAAAERLREPFFLEDAGLFVAALRGFPGVYSAYAFRTLGCQGVLDLLRRAKGGRGAEFRAVVAYRPAKGSVRLFRGSCAGRIATRARGDLGFGFDPIFVPDDGDGRTFGEMTPAEKNRLSHRGRALEGLASHLSRKNAQPKARNESL